MNNASSKVINVFFTEEFPFPVWLFMNERRRRQAG